MPLQLPATWSLLITAFGVYFVSNIVRFYSKIYQLQGIPTIGRSQKLSIFSYYSDALNFIRSGRQVIEEGYKKYHGAAFKVAQMNRWLVVISGHQMIDDMRRAPDDQLSFHESVAENLLLGELISHDFAHNMYHTEVIRGPLTRNIAAQFSEVLDELVCSFRDEIPAKNTWEKFHVVPIIRRVVARTSNRLFVGLPLCRDPEYRQLNIDFTISLVASGRILGLFPVFLRSFLSRFAPVRRKLKLGARLLRPMIEERLRAEKEYGSQWEGRPNDLLSWLLDEAPPELKTVDDLTTRILGTNFAAIHTTSMTFTNALYYLAAFPEYLKPLREEIETVVNEHGWNKTSVGKMRKLDSFLKESQRLTGLGSATMGRKALKDFTFSNGITIPAGTTLAAASYATHHDEAVYPEADKFLPFRFSDMRETDSLKHHMVTPNLDYLLFGNGRHACPGRFFAVNELKVMMAHVILTYDFKLESEGVPPPPNWFGFSLVPNTKAEVLFRAREI